MNISLQTLNIGDTTYIAEMNSNFAALKAAVESVSAALQATPAAQTLTKFIKAMLGDTNTILGETVLLATVSGPTITVSPGYVFDATNNGILQSIATVTTDLTGYTPGIYYAVIDSSGAVGVVLDPTGVLQLYSFSWDGTNISGVSLVPARVSLVYL